MLTLAHFYENEVVAPVVGIPTEMQKLGCFKKPKDLDLGLGRHRPATLIEEMLRLGMIIDLTHCTPKARRASLRALRHPATTDLLPRRRPAVWPTNP